MDDGEEEFRRFVVGETAGLLRAAWLLTGDRMAAEDLLQTALARTWPHWRRISQDGSPPGYVRTVMTRTFLSWRGRRWSAELPSPRLPDTHPVDGGFTAVDDRDRLVRALADLPRGQRAAVVLRHYLDLPEHEVAAVLGCSVGTVKTQTARALARLRAAVASTAEEGERR